MFQPLDVSKVSQVQIVFQSTSTLRTHTSKFCICSLSISDTVNTLLTLHLFKVLQVLTVTWRAAKFFVFQTFSVLKVIETFRVKHLKLQILSNILHTP